MQLLPDLLCVQRELSAANFAGTMPQGLASRWHGASPGPRRPAGTQHRAHFLTAPQNGGISDSSCHGTALLGNTVEELLIAGGQTRLRKWLPVGADPVGDQRYAARFG